MIGPSKKVNLINGGKFISKKYTRKHKVYNSSVSPFSIFEKGIDFSYQFYQNKN
jgi:hypothetical protein